VNTDPSYLAAKLERFGPKIPWSERHKRPPPPPPRLWWEGRVLRVADPPEVTAARRAVLGEVPWREEVA
jgi:hypothetical protein